MKTGYDINKPLDIDGIQPLEFKVLIKLDIVEDKSAGGIYLPESAQDRESYAAERGTIIKKSKAAFGDDDMWPDKPEIGDRVMFPKYSGMLILELGEQREQIKYRLMNDKDVCAILK
jgi:chaperonin GroES